jgi:hypothetical protein
MSGTTRFSEKQWVWSWVNLVRINEETFERKK